MIRYRIADRVVLDKVQDSRQDCTYLIRYRIAYRIVLIRYSRQDLRIVLLINSRQDCIDKVQDNRQDCT